MKAICIYRETDKLFITIHFVAQISAIKLLFLSAQYTKLKKKLFKILLHHDRLRSSPHLAS